MSTAIEILADNIAQSLKGDPWHGPALRTLLVDVTPDEARARPIPGAHSILEVVSHVSSWLEEVTSRALGRAPARPAAGDWPLVLGSDPATAWAAAQDRLAAAQVHCSDTLAHFPVSRLHDQVGSTRDASLGTGFSFDVMFAGLAQHNAYHSGQIALLKRACRGVAG